MPVVIKTLREFLLGALTDFSESAELTDLGSPAHLASLIVSLAHYQEEGHRLIPEVFLCRSADDVMKLLPGSERIEIGERTTAASAVEDALKRCAPLARQGWCIFVERPHTAYRYGLFRGSLNPTAISVERTLFGEPIEGLPMIRLHRFANGCVELRNQKGEVHHLMLSEKASAMAAHSEDAVVKLVSAACSEVPEPHRDALKTCLEKILKRSLGDSHGALIAVTASSGVPRFLRDGVKLRPPIDFLSCVKERLSAAMADKFRLQGTASLVDGMLNSDGITLFNSKGKLIAYNCFVQVQQAKNGIIGGARSRAYAALRGKLGKGLLAVFSQSQDGWTKFEEVSHD